jgi:hypothetical protein
MTPEIVNAIHDLTLEARELLLTEISAQLEGIYGLLPDGQFKPAAEYPVLARHVEAAETRRRLEALFADERQAGLTAATAREKLVKEAAFTWLNRLVAFKMLETRRLLRQTVSRGAESNGFKLWLTESDNEEHYRAYEAGDLPQDGLGEGPRQRAYRRFLLAQCARLAQEVRVLFDPDTLASYLCPRPQALRRLIEPLGADNLHDAWQPGNEETIGWVYQAFNEPDLEVFRGESAMKVPSHLIAAKTQKFTPRWIVKYLVENTLGSMWLEMHPDSQLGAKLEYLVPHNDKRLTLCKSIRDITLLDPACGTMHFGLVAFDLFVEMYREEMANAGKHGWPQSPPLADETEIPAAIVAHNLHGIDIDLRAVQLSALALYLKSKSLNPQTTLQESHLACADIHMLDSQYLQHFLQTAGLDRRPIYGRIMHALHDSLQHAEQLGTLLRLDSQIYALIEQERKLYEQEGQRPDLFGWSIYQFETEAGKHEFWEILGIQIRQALNEFARQQATEGREQSFFTGETTKGLNFLEIISQSYDIVVTNPPYLDSRDMNGVLKNFIYKHYKIGKRNLYSAFVERCLELVKTDGCIGILTGQTFMFISTFEKFREIVRRQSKIETLAQFDYGLFEGIRVDTAAYVLRREPEAQARDEAMGVYFRLVREPNGEAKRRRFEQAVARLRAGQPDTLVVRYRQGDFDAILGSPWVYWITPGLRRLFETLPKLGEIAQPRQGLATADNFRFLRYWWEMGTASIGFGCQSREESESRLEKWYPYMKGGSYRRWYGNQDYIINYGQNGFELKAWADPLYGNSGWSRIIKSTDFYFRRSVTWTDLTSGRFSARFSPGGFIFDVSGSSVFPDDVELVLGVMNSQFAQYVLKLLNPTIHVQVGDLARLPIPTTSSLRLCTLVEQAIALAKADSEADETTYDFIAPPAWDRGIDDVTARHQRLAEIERQIDEEVYLLYGISDDDRAAIEAELAESVGLEADGDENGEAAGEDTEEAVPEAALTPEELARRWIGYAVGIVMGRFQPGAADALGRGHFPDQTAAALRQLADTDGILVLDPGHPDDLQARVLQALQIMLGDTAAAEVVAAATVRSGTPETELRRYFERTFFKEHLQQYRKRPVYWLLQSPGKTYGVWLFHERLTQDTLYRLRGEQYVGSKLRLLQTQLGELRQKRDTAAGRERRRLEKHMAELDTALDDLRAFAARLDAVLQRGYTPHLDDGVLITMAPLWELTPSWPAEPKKCWQALERGEYDWSHQAMDHWPERVRTKCKTNKSYAIAHGLA